MRVTSLNKKRSILNRISYWFYDKFCKEPYIPEGEVKVSIINSRLNGPSTKISFTPKKFIPGIHELYIKQSNVTIL